MPGLRIGDVARRAGVPTTTVRYYERIGLVTPTARSDGGYRLYKERAVDEIGFIRRAQALGFSLPEVAEILALSRAGKLPCDRVVAMARAHLAALDDRMKRLMVFRKRLGRVVDTWETGDCGFTAKGLCTLIELADSPYPERRSRRSR